MATGLGTIYAEMRLSLSKFNADVSEAKLTLSGMSASTASSLASIGNTGAAMQRTGAMMTAGLTAPIVALGKSAIDTGLQFDYSMSSVQAVTSATASEFAAMRAQAIALGGSTIFSAQDAADGMTILAQAGFSVQEVMTALPNMLDLAAAGSLDLEAASAITAATMNAFGETADQTGRYADVYARAAATAATDVATLGEAMSYGAPAAAAMGYTLEETAAIFATLSNAGIDGTRAGTTFEAMMRDLKKSAIDAGGALEYVKTNGEKVSIAYYDAQGNTRKFTDILGDLETSLAGSSTAERDLALSQLVRTQGLRGLNVMLEEGSAGLEQYTDSLYNSKGAGDEMAATMRDNLKGSLEELSSAWDSVKLAVSDILVPVIKKAAEWLQKLATWFTNLSPAGKKTVLIILAIVAVMGPLLMIFGTFLAMIPMISAGFAAIGAAGAVAMGPVLLIIAIIAAVIAIGYLLVKNWDEIKAAAAKVWDGIKEAWGKVEDFSKRTWDKVKTDISDAWDQIEEKTKKTWDTVKNDVTTAWDTVKNSFKNDDLPTAFAKTTMVAAKFTDKLASLLTGIPLKDGKGLASFFMIDVPIAVSKGMTEAGTWVSTTAKNIGQWFSDMWTTVKTTISDAATGVADWAVGIYNDVTGWISKTVTDVGAWFASLPGIIQTWLDTIITNITTWATNLWLTVTTWVSKMVSSVILFFQTMVNGITTWLTNAIYAVQSWAGRLWSSMSSAASRAVSGFMSWISQIPAMVSSIFSTVVNTIVGWATALWSAARTAAASAWKGFKDGLGIHSPSYIEVAMTNIAANTAAKMAEMKNSLGILSGMTVDPLADALGGSTDFSADSVVRYEHSGTIKVVGVNDEEETVSVMDIVMDRMRQEART